MVQAVEQGRIAQARLDQSVRRVLEIKRRAGAVQAAHGAARQRDGRGRGRAEHQLIARDVTARSLVLVRDSGGVVTRLRSRAGAGSRC